MEKMMLTLKACRVNCNIKIYEAATHIGKTERTIKNWESGKSIPNGADLMKLCALYKVSVESIFLGNKEALLEFYKNKQQR